MNISAGKFCFKAQLQLQCRALFISWSEKKSTVTCLKKREYSSSSLPVRYTPKKSSQTEKFKNSDSKQAKDLHKKRLFERSEPSPSLKNEFSHGESVVHKVPDSNFKSRYQSEIFDDQSRESENEFEEMEEPKELCEHRRYNGFDMKTQNNDQTFTTSFDLDVNPQCQDQMLANSKLLENVEQDDDSGDPFEASEDDDNDDDDTIEEVDEESITHQKNVSKPRKNITKLDAENQAVKFLARRALTTVQLKKKLSGKKFPPNIVESVIRDFQSRGLLNDGLYAESYCQSRWTSSTWGPRRIKLELSRKGVSKLDSNKAIELVFKDNKEDSSHGLSKASLDRLFVQTSKQWVKGRDLPEEKRKARVIRWLQYRGFTWNVIGFLLNKLESNHH